MVSCGKKKNRPAKKQKHDLPLQPFTRTLPRESSIDNEEDALLSALLGNSDIGSLKQWKPQDGTSRLHISNNESSGIAIETLYKTAKTRVDRKVSYRLPICPQKVSFTLLEPSMAWIGLGFHEGTGGVQVFINGALVNTTSTNKIRVKMDYEERNGKIGSMIVQQWIGIGRNVHKANKYQLQVCNAASSPSRWLNWIIGVKAPTPPMLSIP